MKKLGFVFLVICLLATMGCNAPEPPKFGVVDVIKVVNSSKAGQKANAEVEALVKAKQAEINSKGEAIKKMEKGLKETPPKGKPEDFNRAVAEYQKLAATADAELKNKAGEMRKTVFERIKKIIEVIGQEEKFLMIFTSDNVPYYQATTDLTDKVIKKYDESAGGNTEAAHPPGKPPIGVNTTTLLVLAILASILLFPILSGRIAAGKGRSFWGGFFLGLILGPLGLAIVLLLSRPPDNR